jgi:cell wall-associated NlpC family hydrolase
MASPAMRPSRVFMSGVAGLMLSAIFMAGAIGVVSAALSGGGSTGGSLEGDTTPTAVASGEITAQMLSLYRAAAATCAGLPWTVLAAIGTVESGNGTSDLPGVHAGANSAGAEGPMQFEPGTFAAYDTPVPAGGALPPNPYDPVDAVYAAARMLCADGAAGGADVPAAVFAYDHDDAYVTKVLALAATFGQATPPVANASTTGAAAVAWALAQVGTPYVWGGETAGVGFDCSGLVQAAYKAAGLALPRVAQNQLDATPPLLQGAELQAGDLVFFGTGPRGISHVGLYIGVRGGRAMMVDAPHTGADVRVEAFPVTPGARWGSDVFVGATRPDT